MKYKYLSTATILAIGLLFVSCPNPEVPDTAPSVTFDANSSNHYFKVDSNEANVTVNLSGQSDVFLVFTNTNNSEVDLPTVRSNGAAASRTGGYFPTGTEVNSSSPQRSPASSTASISGYNPRGSTAITERNSEIARNFIQNRRGSTSIGGKAATPSPSPPVWTATALNSAIAFKTTNMQGGFAGNINVTLRKKTDPIATEHGNRTLYVWVANDSWSTTGSLGTGTGQKRHLVTQLMVDALADKFLSPTAGTSNDVYDWDSNIFGAEWAASKTGYSEGLVPFDADGDGSGEIHIVLWDIDNDNSDNGGILGYFFSYDNQLNPRSSTDGSIVTSSTNYSNEMVAFSIDSVMFADANAGSVNVGNDTGWDLTDYWPAEMVSTLAHEFQHMIHFYQKVVVLNTVGFDTWINEMLSMIAEDLVSSQDKLAVIGPRGVANLTTGATYNFDGRLPQFTMYPDLSLTTWYSGDMVYSSYSLAYAFGAYLVRARGGLETIHAMYTNGATDSSSVASAVSAVEGSTTTFGQLMRDWSAAVLLSDNPYGTPAANLMYNRGDSDTVGFNYTYPGPTETDYTLGSINMYKYAIDVNSDGQYSSNVDYGFGPFIWDSSTLEDWESLKPNANTYYYVGSGSGNVKFRVSVKPGVLVSVIVK